MFNLYPQLNFDLAESNFWKTDNRLKSKSIKNTVSNCNYCNFHGHESHFRPWTNRIRVHRTLIKILCSFIFFSLCFLKTIMLNTSLPNTIDFVNYYLELKQFVEYFNFSIF